MPDYTSSYDGELYILVGSLVWGRFSVWAVFVWDHFAWHSTSPWWLLSSFKSVGHDRKAWLVPLEPRADSRLVLFYKIVHGYIAVSLRLYIIASNRILRTSHELAYRQIDARQTSFTRRILILTIHNSPLMELSTRISCHLDQPW